MIIFDGKKFAAEKEKQLKLKVAKLREGKITPKLVSILVGDNPESELYASLKKKAAERVEIEMEIVRFSGKVSSEKVIKDIEKLNKNSKIHGIMVQLPIPKKLRINPPSSLGGVYLERSREARDFGGASNYQLTILSAIDPRKDVDCLTPENLGLLMMGKPRFLPATVKAVVEIIGEAVTSVILGSKATPESDPGQALRQIRQAHCRQAQGLARMTTGAVGMKKWLAGESVCLIGASDIVGKPLAVVLSDAGATVTICRSTTVDLGDFTKKADILISATGVPGLIKKEMVKKGAAVMDVGITRYEDIRILGYKVIGDVNEEVREVAGFLTPVPGGVGPVTVICLLENLLEIYQNYV